MTPTHPRPPAPNPASPTYKAPPVIRSYALSVDAFDHLKAMQRAYERQDGAPLTNSGALDRVLKEHQAGQYGTPT